jgi:hypothetical protein
VKVTLCTSAVVRVYDAQQVSSEAREPLKEKPVHVMHVTHHGISPCIVHSLQV